jgi:hypothetical protein
MNAFAGAKVVQDVLRGATLMEIAADVLKQEKAFRELVLCDVEQLSAECCEYPQLPLLPVLLARTGATKATLSKLSVKGFSCEQVLKVAELSNKLITKYPFGWNAEVDLLLW